MVNFLLDLFFLSKWHLRELKGVPTFLEVTAYGRNGGSTGCGLVSILNPYQLLEIHEVMSYLDGF